MAATVYKLDMLAEHQVYRLRSGVVVPGVTSIIGILNKPALLNWAHKMGREGKSIHRVRDAAADTGTVTHARIEAWLRGWSFDKDNTTPANMRASSLGLGQFQEWWQRQGLEVEIEKGGFPGESTALLEHQMVSESMRCGGTLDIMAKRGRVRALIDIKTGKGIYDEARMQTATYARMFEEERISDAGSSVWHVDEVWIVRVPKVEGDHIETVQVRDVAKWADAFAALAGAYHALDAAGYKVKQ